MDISMFDFRVRQKVHDIEVIRPGKNRLCQRRKPGKPNRQVWTRKAFPAQFSHPGPQPQDRTRIRRRYKRIFA
jgi:hypothetical protein